MSAGTTWIVNYRKHILNHIIAERENCRQRIREALTDLVSASANNNTVNIAIALQKIKIEINPYGIPIPGDGRKTKKRKVKKKKVKDDYYLKDSHLWVLIAEYQANVRNKTKLQRLI